MHTIQLYLFQNVRHLVEVEYWELIDHKVKCRKGFALIFFIRMTKNFAIKVCEYPFSRKMKRTQTC